MVGFSTQANAVPEQVNEYEGEGEQAEHERLRHQGGHIEGARCTWITTADHDRVNGAENPG